MEDTGDIDDLCDILETKLSVTKSTHVVDASQLKFDDKAFTCLKYEGDISVENWPDELVGAIDYIAQILNQEAMIPLVIERISGDDVILQSLSLLIKDLNQQTKTHMQNDTYNTSLLLNVQHSLYVIAEHLSSSDTSECLFKFDLLQNASIILQLNVPSIDVDGLDAITPWSLIVKSFFVLIGNLSLDDTARVATQVNISQCFYDIYEKKASIDLQSVTSNNIFLEEISWLELMKCCTWTLHCVLTNTGTNSSAVPKLGVMLYQKLFPLFSLYLIEYANYTEEIQRRILLSLSYVITVREENGHKIVTDIFDETDMSTLSMLLLMAFGIESNSKHHALILHIFTFTIPMSNQATVDCCKYKWKECLAKLNRNVKHYKQLKKHLIELIQMDTTIYEI